jgi:hypothetical protein
MLRKIKTFIFKLLNPINKNIWFLFPDPKSVFGGKKALASYDKALKIRQNSFYYEPSNEALDIARIIEKDGFYIYKDFLGNESVDKLYSIVEDKLDSGSQLINLNLTQTEFRENVPFAAIEQPFVNVPEIIPIALDSRIIDITSAYLNCKSALGTCNLRKSYVNNVSETTTQLFHVDPNSPKFLKCFIYLNDVDLDGGPFCYVKGSHRRKFQGWNTKYRWGKDDIHEIYGLENIVYLTAKKGDLIIADTNAFHRGIKPIKMDRTMLTLDYTCHFEGFEETSKFLFPKFIYEKLDLNLKEVTSFVELV